MNVDLRYYELKPEDARWECFIVLNSTDEAWGEGETARSAFNEAAEELSGEQLDTAEELYAAERQRFRDKFHL